MRIQNRPKLNIAICDDEAASRERLRQLSEQTLGEDWDLSIFCTEFPAAVLEQADRIHIAVLDIQMPEENGIELSRKIRERNPSCCIIFVSGYIRFVSDVYEVPHLCMVLKEQLAVQLPKYLLRAANAGSMQRVQLVLKTAGVEQRLALETICFLERQGHVTYIRLKNGYQIQTREKLEALLGQIPSGQMCRCHVSYAVNLQWVERMQEKEFVMCGETRIPISRANKQTAKKQYFDYLKSRA